MSAIRLVDVGKFKNWLQSQGAEILTVTNDYELLRFHCNAGTGVVYRNKAGRTSTNNNFVDEAFQCWRQQKPLDWKAKPAKRKGASKKKNQLLLRDGDQCFYCGQVMADDDMTVEHLICISAGGLDRIENCVLAHDSCNNKAGHLSLIEKLKLRETMRKQAAE